jgi:mono/diheme cytochrome c family protein
MLLVRPFALLSLVLLATVGCSKPEAPRFHLNMITAINNNVGEQEQQHVSNILTALYGTPDKPAVPPESPLNLQLLRRAAGPVATDIEKRKSGLFREHCVHCHGIGGDGMGPTAAFLNPYPRDYRMGKFKFKSTATMEMPTDADLMKILVNGIEGTSMPSFKLLSESDRKALVEYVKYLSMRGQTEDILLKTSGDYLNEVNEKQVLKLDDSDTLDAIKGSYSAVAEKWAAAKDQIIPIPAPPSKPLNSPELIAAGRAIFYNTSKNQCVNCHGVSGLGDGQLTGDDDWTKEVRAALTKANNPESGSKKLQSIVQQFSLEPRHIIPRNLRKGIYRGGRTPYDLYYRVVAGINGSGMPAHANTITSEDDRWAVVAYLMSLPFDVGGSLGFEQEAAPSNARATQ